MRLALELGYEQVEAALLAGSIPGAHDHDEWRHNDPPPIPPMTANQALQLLHLHAKTVHLQEEPPTSSAAAANRAKPTATACRPCTKPARPWTANAANRR